MPYFIYRITNRPIRMLQKLDQQETYRDAALAVKRLRGELPEGSNAAIRMIHAGNELEAEDLLNQVREAVPGPGDE